MDFKGKKKVSLPPLTETSDDHSKERRFARHTNLQDGTTFFFFNLQYRDSLLGRFFFKRVYSIKNFKINILLNKGGGGDKTPVLMISVKFVMCLHGIKVKPLAVQSQRS